MFKLICMLIVGLAVGAVLYFLLVLFLKLMFVYLIPAVIIVGFALYFVKAMNKSEQRRINGGG